MKSRSGTVQPARSQPVNTATENREPERQPGAPLGQKGARTVEDQDHRHGPGRHMLQLTPQRRQRNQSDERGERRGERPTAANRHADRNHHTDERHRQPIRDCRSEPHLQLNRYQQCRADEPIDAHPVNTPYFREQPARPKHTAARYRRRGAAASFARTIWSPPPERRGLDQTATTDHPPTHERSLAWPTTADPHPATLLRPRQPAHRPHHREQICARRS